MLHVCATPIGNLGDVTLRVLETLRSVELIAAEDTRRTRKLLAHYDIHTPLTSLFSDNEAQKTAYVLGLLREGKDVALVSDAGLPSISDPGLRLVARAVAELLEPDAYARFRTATRRLHNRAVFEIPDMLERILEECGRPPGV